MNKQQHKLEKTHDTKYLSGLGIINFKNVERNKENLKLEMFLQNDHYNCS